MSHTHKIAWAAGFFDGEGYVTISRRNHNGYQGHYLRIGVNHVAIEPLLKLQELFGGKIEKQNPDKVTGNRKPRHRWIMSCKSAADVLKQLMPYLINKVEVAVLALDFQKTMSNSTRKLSEDVSLLRESYKRKLMELNSKD